MDIKEIANKYTRAEFVDIIEEPISKDTFIEIGTEKVMCPAEINGLNEFCQLECEFCWKRSIKDVKFKDEQYTFKPYTTWEAFRIIQYNPKVILVSLNNKKTLSLKNDYVYIQNLKNGNEDDVNINDRWKIRSGKINQIGFGNGLWKYIKMLSDKKVNSVNLYNSTVNDCARVYLDSDNNICVNCRNNINLNGNLYIKAMLKENTKGGDSMSKEYSFKEVIARIKPGEKYVCTNELSDVIDVNLTKNNVYKITRHNEHTSLFINDVLKFVKEKKPVPFIDAIKTYQDGHTIYCQWAGDVTVYVPDNVKVNSFVVDSVNRSITAGEILEGKWYVE